MRESLIGTAADKLEGEPVKEWDHAHQSFKLQAQVFIEMYMPPDLAPDEVATLKPLLAMVFRENYMNGVRTFAHHKDGYQYVGTGGMRLFQAEQRVLSFDAPLW